MIPSICRVCLRGDLRTQQIVDDKLLELHHKLTDTTKLVHDVGLALCYICCSILQRCRRYSDMSQESDRLLQGLMDNGIEITHETIDTLQQKRLAAVLSLSTLDIPTFNYNGNPDHENMDNILCKVEYDEGSMDYEEVQQKEELDEFVECIIDKSKVEIKNKNLRIGGCNDNIKEKDIEMTSLETRHVRFEDSYKCDKTENTSKQQFENKNVHLQLHNYAMPYSCDMSHDELNNQSDAKPTCDNAGLISNLTTHDTGATGTTPYPCEQCGKEFSVKRNLKRHVERIHSDGASGNKKRPCSLCVLTFLNTNELNNHIKTAHSDGKPTCDTCGKAFKNKSGLKKHLVTHEVNSYICNVCGEVLPNCHDIFESTLVNLRNP